MNCSNAYSNTGRLFHTRPGEYQENVNSTPQEKYTKNIRNKSAITDHTTNHFINWQGAEVVDTDSDRRKRHMREAIWKCHPIRKSSQ